MIVTKVLKSNYRCIRCHNWCSEFNIEITMTLKKILLALNTIKIKQLIKKIELHHTKFIINKIYKT